MYFDVYEFTNQGGRSYNEDAVGRFMILIKPEKNMHII